MRRPEELPSLTADDVTPDDEVVIICPGYEGCDELFKGRISIRELLKLLDRERQQE